ncbi:MAG: RecX family transcriptional regulator [Flavobacteriales bacterium]|nr:RecX family transcriptional regulator [Flavobacteriales bacterium]
MCSANTVLHKARAWCARQERCQQEVREKLYASGGHKEEVEQTIAQLIGEGFLNEARFAEHFAVSKSRQKGWGRRKIELALKVKGVSASCIASGLKAIDAEEETAQLRNAVARRWERTQETDGYIRREKVIRYFVGKGFGREQVERVMDSTH